MKYKFLSILTMCFGVSLLFTGCGMETERDFRTLSPGSDTAGGSGDSGGVSFPGGIKNDNGKGENKDPNDPTDPDDQVIPNTKLGWGGLSHLEPVAFEIISVE